MQFFYVYILQSEKDKKWYTGFTTDLKKRLKYHHEGKNKSTRNRRPFVLIYAESYINEHDARAREFFLKTGRGKEVIRKQLNNTIHAGVV